MSDPITVMIVDDHEMVRHGASGYLEALPQFEPLYQRNLEIYNSDERIAYPSQSGDHVFNFWRDENNKRGLFPPGALPCLRIHALMANATWATTKL